jgi:hypothetical protein
VEKKQARIERDNRMPPKPLTAVEEGSSLEGAEARERLKQDLIAFADKRSRRLRSVPD